MDEIYPVINTFFDYKIVQDILTGVYASIFFLLIISRLKPQIKICDRISLVVDTKKPAGQRYIYYFKIINRSWLFKIYDLNVRVYSSSKRSSANGENEVYNDITLKKDKMWLVNRMNLLHLFQDFRKGENRITSRTDYAAQFVTFDNIVSMLKSGKTIKFELIARHSLTGFTRVVSKEFKHESEVINGTFLSGNSCEVYRHKK